MTTSTINATFTPEGSTTGIQVSFTPESIFTKAKSLAKAIALLKGTVTTDDVFNSLDQVGEDTSGLGTSAGNLFRTGFVFTGELVKSVRPSNRGRKIRVWKLADVVSA